MITMFENFYFAVMGLGETGSWEERQCEGKGKEKGIKTRRSSGGDTDGLQKLCGTSITVSSSHPRAGNGEGKGEGAPGTVSQLLIPPMPCP